MIKYKLTKVIEDKLFGKYEFTYKFFTSDEDGAVYVAIYNNKTHTRMLNIKLRNLEYKNAYIPVFIPKVINELGLSISYERVIEKYIELEDEDRIDNSLEESFIYIGETLSERIKHREDDSLILVEESENIDGELTIPDYDFYAHKGFKLGLYYDYAVEEFLFTYINLDTDKLLVQEENVNLLGYNIKGEEDFSPNTPDEFYPHKFYIKCNVDTFKELQKISDSFEYALRKYSSGEDISYNHEIRCIISNKDLYKLNKKNKQYNILERYLYLYYGNFYSLENQYMIHQCNDRCNTINKNSKRNNDAKRFWHIETIEDKNIYFMQSPIFNTYKTRGGKDLFYTEVVIIEDKEFDINKYLNADRQVDYLITSDNRLFVKYYDISTDKIWDGIGNKDIDDIMTEFITEKYNKIIDDNEGNIIEVSKYFKGVRTIYVDYKNTKLELDDKMRKMLKLVDQEKVEYIMEYYNKYIEEVNNYVKDYVYRSNGDFKKAIDRLSEDVSMNFDDDVLQEVYRNYGMEMYYIGE